MKVSSSAIVAAMDRDAAASHRDYNIVLMRYIETLVDRSSSTADLDVACTGLRGLCSVHAYVPLYLVATGVAGTLMCLIVEWNTFEKSRRQLLRNSTGSFLALISCVCSSDYDDLATAVGLECMERFANFTVSMIERELVFSGIAEGASHSLILGGCSFLAAAHRTVSTSAPRGAQAMFPLDILGVTSILEKSVKFLEAAGVHVDHATEPARWFRTARPPDGSHVSLMCVGAALQGLTKQAPTRQGDYFGVLSPFGAVELSPTSAPSAPVA